MKAHGPCRLPLIGWKCLPQAWWPEVPGKSTPKGWNPMWTHSYDKKTSQHNWESPVAIKSARLCKECRQVKVKSIKRYCSTCANRRRRSQTRSAVAKIRSSVSKTGFSSIAAEVLTKPKTQCGYDDPRTTISGSHFQTADAPVGP
jgi:hypothetical protein